MVVAQKTRKTSESKSSKGAAAKAASKSAKTVKKAAAASRGATKGRVQASSRDVRKAGKTVTSSNKRSAMPHKTAKAAPKAVSKTVAKGSGAKAAKPAAKPVKPAAKAPVKPVAPAKAAAPKAAPPKAAPAKAAAPAAKPAAPVKAAAPVAKPAAPVAKPEVKAAAPVAAKAPAPVAAEPKKPITNRQGFKTNEFVVYPAHGVGQILAIEEQEIAGLKLELFVINFIKDKMTLRVPTAKVANVGMRKLSDPSLVKKALETLKGRARIKRTMWSRRAQEYEAKINSGDIVAIAEVVRDLFRSDSQPEQSYSERQLYEAALDRLSREIAAVQHVTETEAVKEIEGQLAKSPRRGAKAEGAEGEADADADGDDDSAVTDEAA